MIECLELGSEEVGLFEVIAEDLLQFGLTSGKRWNRLEPIGEPLVELRTVALQQAAVDHIAEQHAAEAVIDERVGIVGG